MLLRVTNSIRNMLCSVSTRDCVNNYISEPFLLQKGILQEDPILFTVVLGIETLSRPISKVLHFKDHLSPNQYVTTLFYADDITLFMFIQQEFDRISSLVSTFCSVIVMEVTLTKLCYRATRC